MSQLDKLVARLRARPVTASIGDVRKVLDAYGWELRSQKGSHLSFRKPGDARLLTICAENGKTVKTVYLDKVCDYLGLDD